MEKKFVIFFRKFKLQLISASFFSTIPFDWNEKTQKVILFRSQAKRIFHVFQLLIQWAYTIIATFNFFTPTSWKFNGISKNLLAIFFLVGFNTTSFFRYDLWIKKEETVMLWNSFLHFDSKLSNPSPNSKLTLGDKIAKTIMFIASFSSVAFGGFVFFLLLLDPFTPPFLGHIFYKQANECLVPKFSLMKVLMLTFDAWIWISLVFPLATVGGSAIFLLKCLQSYLKSLLIGAVEMSRFSSFGKRMRFEKSVKMFRNLELLVKTYDSALQAALLPVLWGWGGVFCIGIGLFACVKLHKEIPMPAFSLFPMLIADGLSIAYMVRDASTISFHSKMFIKIIPRRRDMA